VGTTTGSFLFFESKELLKTLSAARELMAVLLKKRAILAGYKDRNNSANYENNLRMDNINAIYQERMERLKSEWQEALKGVTDLKNNNDRDMLSIDNQIKALDFEIERYRVEDENVIKDHWSLNPSEFVIK
jgi:transcription initiation factor IIF auxiliary subunit